MCTFVMFGSVLYGDIRTEQLQPHFSNTSSLQHSANCCWLEEDLGVHKVTRSLKCLVWDDCELEEVVVMEAKVECCPSMGDEDRRPRHL